MESGIIPANAHFKEVNHAIPKKWHFKFPTAATPFPKTASGVRRISINSFGISGTNAHVVLEDARHFLESHGCDAPHRTIAEPRLAGTTGKFKDTPNLIPPCRRDMLIKIMYSGNTSSHQRYRLYSATLSLQCLRSRWCFQDVQGIRRVPTQDDGFTLQLELHTRKQEVQILVEGSRRSKLGPVIRRQAV